MLANPLKLPVILRRVLCAEGPRQYLDLKCSVKGTSAQVDFDFCRILSILRRILCDGRRTQVLKPQLCAPGLAMANHDAERSALNNHFSQKGEEYP